MALTINAVDIDQSFKLLDTILDTSDRINLIAFHSQSNRKKYFRVDQNNFSELDGSLEKAFDWIERVNNEGYNIYYTLNTPSPTCKIKPKTEDLTHIIAYHVDIDYDGKGHRDEWFKKKIKQVKKFRKGSVIVNTGNGLQVLFFTDSAAPMSDDVKEETESVNIKIAHALGGDATHDVSRILRLPGTINWPTEKKKSKGFIPVKSALIACDDVVSFYPKDFEDIKVVKKKKQSKSARYTNYLADVKYAENYKPISYENLLEVNPMLDDWEPSEDRSEACFSNIYNLMRSMCLYLSLDREDFTDNEVKNLCHIIVDLDDDCLGHYEEHKYGFGKLGYDVQKVLYSEVWPDLDPAKRAGKLTKELAEALGLVSEENEEIQISTIEDIKDNTDAENASTVYIYSALSTMIDTNNLVTKAIKADGTLAAAQPCTLANVEAMCRMMGLVVRFELQKGFFDCHFKDPELNRALRIIFRTDTSEVDDEYKMQFLTSLFANFGMRDHAQISASLLSVARNNPYYEFEEWLRGIEWDGKDYISAVCGTIKSDTRDYDIYIRLMLRQIVATILSFHEYRRNKKGLQISGSLILVGDQGIKKSTWFSELLPAKYVSSGTSLQMGSATERDKTYLCLDGSLCVLNEIGQTTKRSEMNALKDFLTSTVDTFRRAYHKVETRKGRMTAFCGTANEFSLSDETGSRRYWPIEVQEIDIDGLKEIDKGQLFAQVYREVIEENRIWWLTDAQEKVRQATNDKYQTMTAEEGALSEFLSRYGDLNEKSYEWLNITSLCKLIGVKYSQARQRYVVKGLEAYDIEFKDSVKVNGVVLRKAYKFPVPAHLRDEII